MLILFICVISLQTVKPTILNFNELYFNFKKGNYIDLNNYFNFIDWRSELGSDINVATKHFYDIIYEAINIHIPTCTYFFSKYKFWFSTELKKMVFDKKN